MSDPPKPRRFDRDVDGILLLDKAVGLSSNAALQQARTIFRALKAGHAGSLDPLASGMLPVCFGQATKICTYLLEARKSYRFVAKLGERTDTGDAEGAVVERQSIPNLSAVLIEAALQASVGKQSQVPPMYSALKHQGQRLYDLARRGETVERAPRSIQIDELRLVSFDGAEIEVQIRCSKGTYVRTVAEDLALKLGTVAHLTALRRQEVEPFAERSMHTLEALSAVEPDAAAQAALLIPADQALTHLSAMTFDTTGKGALLHGRSAVGGCDSALSPGDFVRMYGPGGVFLGVGQASPEGSIQPRRLLVKSASGL